MGEIIVGAIIGAVVSAGSAAYQADEQKKAAKKDRERRESAAADEQARLDQIAADTKPEEESLAEIEYGGTDDDPVSTYNDFLTPTDKKKKSTTLGTSQGSGLNASGGFNVA